VNVVSFIANVAMVLALEPATAPPSAAPAPKAEILGVWKGTSICTKVEGNEFCRDETVVYEVVDVPGQPATVTIKAGRVADNSLLPMYALFFTYRPDQGQWTSQFDRGGRRGVWAYVIHGDEMTGTATILPSMTIVRNVAAKRFASDPARDARP
jgi:hypothetical protein